MKTILLFATLIIATTLNATVYTVSNDPSGGAQYSTLQIGYNSASNGDTLLIEGTNVGYTMLNDWNKKLVVIGIGFNPTKANPRHAMIAQVSSTGNKISFSSGGNGSTFYGIHFAYTSNYTNLTGAVLNYTFEDCLFDSNFSMNNQSVGTMLFRNCIFNVDNNGNVSLSASGIPNSNISFVNCVFDGTIDGSSSISSGLIIDHCLFLQTTANTLYNLQNALIKNSIFMNNATIALAGSINNTFTNNISRLATTYPPAGNIGSGNLSSTDPMFTTYTNGTLYSNTQNYKLQSGSPAIGIADDATDIGVHGGSSHFSETGEVLINPIIRSLNINNISVAPNGNLNVDIHATKPNDQ